MLIDLASEAGRPLRPGEVATPDDLRAALAAQAGSVHPGDALWIRTGAAPSRDASVPVGHADAAGVSFACAELIAHWSPSVILTDGGMDASPSEVEGIPVPWHVLLLTGLGVPLIDFADLTRLARHCQNTGRWDFLSVIAPLPLPGASGSPETLWRSSDGIDGIRPAAPGAAAKGRPAQYAPGIARRAAIMDAAFVAFGTVGYWNTTMQQIADDCGVTRAGLLHHFPTKEALLEAVLARRDELNRARFFQDSWPPGRDGRQFLVRMVRLVLYNASQPGIINLFAVLSAEAIAPNHPAHAYFEHRYERTKGWIREAFLDVQARGGLRPGVDIDEIDVELVSLLDGLQIQWLYSPESVDMTARFRARLALVLVEPLTDAEIEADAARS